MNAGRTLALATLVVIAIAGPASARQTEAADGYVFQRKEIGHELVHCIYGRWHD